MGVWDIHPGYLNRQSLLGEHRELHGAAAILGRGLKGDAAHPETKRWAGRGWALRQRHRLLAAEMAFRGCEDRSPMRSRTSPGCWPATFVDAPGRQFAILRDKYRDKEPGRIPLPRSPQELWAQHKYSVLARDQAAYRDLGRRVSALRGQEAFETLASELVAWLRRAPAPGNLRNALQHMQGYLESGASPPFDQSSPTAALKAIQRGATCWSRRPSPNWRHGCRKQMRLGVRQADAALLLAQPAGSGSAPRSRIDR